MVEVFREVRRVLRPDGTLWLNLGDSYNGSGGVGSLEGKQGTNRGSHDKQPIRAPGLKPKDLCMIPARVALALQADGWYLRSDIVWAKPNAMPESVNDRPTKAHEYIFLLAKSERYYYDADAIREPHSDKTVFTYPQPDKAARVGVTTNGTGASTLRQMNPAGRNRRSVWWIATEPTPYAHFATYPQALVEPCILAGTSPMACPHCRAPWERVVERVTVRERIRTDASPKLLTEAAASARAQRYSPPNSHDGRSAPIVTTIGWRPTCSCEGNDGSGRCIVLDPFAGSGTTLLVAARLGREAIGIELNPTYVHEVMRKRLSGAKAQRQLVL